MKLEILVFYFIITKQILRVHNLTKVVKKLVISAVVAFHTAYSLSIYIGLLLNIV